VDAAALWKRIALKAALSPVTFATWAGTAGAAVWLHSPWPLPVGAGLSLAWILVGSRSARYRDAVLADLRKEREAQAAAERALAIQQVGTQLDEPPLRGWIQSGLLPDYLQIYRRLSEIRDRVARIAHERAQVEAVGREELIERLDAMLGSYLQFVRERISYLQILNNIRVGGDADGVSPAPPASPIPGWATPAPPPAGFEAGRRQKVGTVPPAAGAARPAAPGSEPPGMPSFERRLAEVEGKIARLRELAEQEPSTAKTREWHIGILEKQRDLLRECRERDQHVVAQLGVFTDVFEVILARVSATQFSPGEIVSSIAPVVEQIEATERFIESLRPAMDELMGTVRSDPSPSVPLPRMREG
jgi:hypothetical protein